MLFSGCGLAIPVWLRAVLAFAGLVEVGFASLARAALKRGPTGS
jgi:hypothetical protein